MDNNQIANVYRQERAHGNHPVELVGKLYDAILEDFLRALKGVDAGDIPGRNSSLNHALQIIAELQSVLDHERGGEVAHRLDGFYNVTRSLVIEANIRGTAQHIQRLFDLYLPLRQAWKQVERDASTGKLNAIAPEKWRTDGSAFSDERSSATSPEATQARWSA